MDGFETGKGALKACHERLRAGVSAKQQMQIFANYIVMQSPASSMPLFSPASLPRIRKTLVILQEDVQKAIECICRGWERIFYLHTSFEHDQPLLSWASLCAPLLTEESGRSLLCKKLLRGAGQSDSTASLHGSLLARINPSLLIAVAIMDGAEVHLSHTHQKDIVMRLFGIRLHIVITQSNCISFCAINFSRNHSAKGTYPLSEPAKAFLETGQSWRSAEGVDSSSNLFTILQNGGFCSADREFLSLGFLHQQFLTHAVASKYLALAVQAHEIVSLHLATQRKALAGSQTTEQDRQRDHVPSHALEGLSDLLCCEFFDKIGRPNSSRLRAQILAIRLQHWVAYFMRRYEGFRDPTQTEHTRDPPTFDDFEESCTEAHIVKTSVESESAIKEKESSQSISNAAAAWLACWSVCRMLAHVQIIPAFLGTHASDATCWVS